MRPAPTSRVSLLTFGPGPIFWERFGHNAIVVRDHDAGTAIALQLRHLRFRAGKFPRELRARQHALSHRRRPLDDDIEMYYARKGRSITEQRLAFTPEQAAALRDFLRWNMRPENAFYRYDYYLANCSTRVRDALDKALGGAIKTQLDGRSRGYTYRMDSLRLMAPNRC